MLKREGIICVLMLDLFMKRERDGEIIKALKELSEEKRQIILLSYFFDMSDQKNADSLSGVRRTIQYKRSMSLKELKRIMEELFDNEEL